MSFSHVSGAICLAALLTSAGAEPQGKGGPIPPGLACIDQIPDLVQTDPKGNFARGGKSYCGPVAVSNSLVWLKAGSKGKVADKEAQYEVVNRLASAGYMRTDPVAGVGAVGLIRGVRRFVEEDIGDRDFTLAYQGWRSMPKGSDTGVRTPELDWMRTFVGPGKSAWINLGWYRHDKEKDQYERIGGHWVTVVGCGGDEEGRPHERIIVVHDPAPRAGQEPNEFVLLTPLKRGTLTGKGSGLPRPAKGLFLMGGGMHLKATADVAILDGVVGLDLKRPAPAEGKL